MVRATVFGGPKSRLRSHVAPFHGGILWIYHDPVRDSRKVSDFDVKSWRPGIRELWERAMTADAVAETVLSSMGGGGSGNWETALKLTENVLDAISEADPAACVRIGIYFLWHWARILGIRPDFSICSACNNERKDEGIWYSLRNEAFFCENCLIDHNSSKNTAIHIETVAKNWLKAAENQAPSALMPISAPYLNQVRTLSQSILAASLGKRLPTWELM